MAELKSFAAAANRLGLSAAMASKHVQHVESRFGARLLNRTSRSVSLTEAGTIYLARVRPLLEGLDEAEAQVAQVTTAPRGILKVSLPVWMATTGFARTIAAYAARYPHVTLDLELSGKQVNLVEEGFDLALRVARTLDEGLIARRLTDIYFQLIGAPALLDRIGRPSVVAELNGAPLLAYTPIAAGGRLHVGEGAGVDVRFSVAVQSSNETLLHLAAREGMGLAFMPHLMIEDDLKTGVLECVLPEQLDKKLALYAVYPDRSYLPAKVRSFLDFLAGIEGIGNICSRDVPA